MQRSLLRGANFINGKSWIFNAAFFSAVIAIHQLVAGKLYHCVHFPLAHYFQIFFRAPTNPPGGYGVSSLDVDLWFVHSFHGDLLTTGLP